MSESRERPVMFPILVPSKIEGQPPEVHRITRDEKDAADAFIKLGSFELAGQELGIAASTVMHRTNTPGANLYMKKRAHLAAQAAGLTTEKILAIINMSIEGEIDLSPSQARALDLGAKILKLVQPTSQHLHFSKTENHWHGVSDEKMEQEFQNRLNYIKAKKTSDSISRDATA